MLFLIYDSRAGDIQELNLHNACYVRTPPDLVKFPKSAPRKTSSSLVGIIDLSYRNYLTLFIFSALTCGKWMFCKNRIHDSMSAPATYVFLAVSIFLSWDRKTSIITDPSLNEIVVERLGVRLQIRICPSVTRNRSVLYLDQSWTVIHVIWFQACLAEHFVMFLSMNIICTRRSEIRLI